MARAGSSDRLGRPCGLHFPTSVGDRHTYLSFVGRCRLLRQAGEQIKALANVVALEAIRMADETAVRRHRRHHNRRRGERRRPRPESEVVRRASDIDLLRDLDRVIDLDAELANGALDLRMPEQELHRAQIASAPVDQHRLRSAQRMRTELRRVETDAGHPFQHEPSVLTRGQPAIRIAPAGEQQLSCLSAREPQVVIDRLSCLVGQLESDWPAVFFCLMVARSMA